MGEQPGRIGPYIVEREIGRGGMGVVYRAHDSRLGRTVAVKALPEHLAHDPDRLARFEREARTLASLNHPNIAAIHGLEIDGPHRYLVLEFVEGEPLSARVERGPMPVDEALETAVQIAEALDAAHEKGVVHRDLKPGNVMVTPEGVAKVLDFGLARTGEGSASSSRIDLSPDSPTLERASPIHSPTIPGAIMGTAGYMSPEQARGRAVDKRSDVFSFGCVLYEMLTGVRPFAGDTVADVLGATLHKDLDLSLLPASTPARVRDLLSMCLEKDRRNRLHDIGDARIALRRAIERREWTHTAPATGAAHRRPAWATASMLALGGAALLGLGWLGAAMRAPVATPNAPAMRFFIPSETAQYERAQEAVISPDGRLVVFVARAAGTDRWNLWVRALDSFEARALPETTGADQPFWSWDSRSVAFHADGKLWSADLEQGGARRLIAAEPGNYGATWGPKGDILLSPVEGASRIVRIAPGSGVAEPISTPDDSSFERKLVFPRFLPDGERYFFLSVTFVPDQEVRTGRLYVGRLGSTERTLVANLISETWYIEPGWLVYVEDGSIKALPFDLDSLRVTGESVTVGDDADYFQAYGETSLSVASNGAMIYTPPAIDAELVWFDKVGKRVGRLGPKGDINRFRISPDGSRVAVGVGDRRTGASDIWIYGINRPTVTRLTTDARWEDGPLWSPDGSTIYLSTDHHDAPWVFSMPADGSGPLKKVYGRDSGGSVWFANDISPDGSTLLLQGLFERLGLELRVLDLKGPGPAAPFRSTPATENQGRFSPDGRWVAFVSDESGRGEVYLTAYPGPGPSVQVSEHGGWWPEWSPGGDRLYFLHRPVPTGSDADSDGAVAIMGVDLTTPESFRSPPPPRTLFAADGLGMFDVSPDGERFLVQLNPQDTPLIRVMLNALPAR